jgi:hypothetical protein
VIKRYTLAELKQLADIAMRLAHEAAPPPRLKPESWEDDLTAATLIRDTAIRGYICWWLTVQPASETTAELEEWWRSNHLTALWSWQTGSLLWTIREQADAVGEPDDDLKDTPRPPAEWKGPDQVVRDLAEAVENLASVGPDLYTWAAASAVFMDDITEAAARELASPAGGTDAVLLALAGTASPQGETRVPQPEGRQARRAPGRARLRREVVDVGGVPVRGVPAVAHRPQGRSPP